MPRHSQKEITYALTALAFRAGDYNLAVRDLKKQNINIVKETLERWATEMYPMEYDDVKANFKDRYEEEAMAGMRQIIRESAQAEALAVQRVLETIYATDDPKAAAQAAYYLSQVKKNSIEKLRLLGDKPTEIVEDRTPEMVMRNLVARGIIKPSAN
jgi:hypothetical protein